MKTETEAEKSQRELGQILKLKSSLGWVLLEERINGLRKEAETDILENDKISADERENKRHYLKAIKEILKLPQQIEDQANGIIDEDRKARGRV